MFYINVVIWMVCSDVCMEHGQYPYMWEKKRNVKIILKLNITY